jgi:hypothetical protein
MTEKPEWKQMLYAVGAAALVGFPLFLFFSGVAEMAHVSERDSTVVGVIAAIAIFAHAWRRVP